MFVILRPLHGVPPAWAGVCDGNDASGTLEVEVVLTLNESFVALHQVNGSVVLEPQSPQRAQVRARV